MQGAPTIPDNRKANRTGTFIAALLICGVGAAAVGTPLWGYFICEVSIFGETVSRQGTQIGLYQAHIDVMKGPGKSVTFKYDSADCLAWQGKKVCDDLKDAGNLAGGLLITSIILIAVTGLLFVVGPSLIGLKFTRLLVRLLIVLTWVLVLTSLIGWTGKKPRVTVCGEKHTIMPSFSWHMALWTGLLLWVLRGALIVALREAPSGWTFGLANVHEECGYCMYTTFCRSCMAGQTRAAFTGQDCCGPCLLHFCASICWCAYCFVIGEWRTQYRERFGIPGDKCDDRIIHCPFGCTCCALIQERREIDNRVQLGLYTPGVMGVPAAGVMPQQQQYVSPYPQQPGQAPLLAGQQQPTTMQYA